ncbi:PREDICTED: putative cyclin-A3-1 [Tarenaya hassleriana]|uniref:putative cyclin-A3-1 n=1 Tax=Tarenaya hassleriana TaxID=28532 RepID=UPI00053C65E2|nr:PREDICTED: putative cyclin-A3-1 [Tarenaya hassleriana]
MANQESACLRVTRAIKKRSAAAAAMAEVEDCPVGKRRVVLGELKNLANIVVSVNPNLGKETQKAKGKGKGRVAKAKRVLIPATEEDESAATDIDAKSDDPQMCAAYVKDIFEYLCKMEAEPNRRASHNYLEKIQNDITANMRGVLVDWLVEVAEEYRLVADTLYLTVNYVDRFLSQKSLERKKLQLLGVSSMLIASKYEEIKPPNVDDFCYITDNTYTGEEVVKMEADILSALKFELGSPTAVTFLRRFIRISLEDYNNSNSQLEFLAHYLAELSMLDYECVKFLPSLVAASAMFLARFIIRPKAHPWSESLQRYTKYRPADVKQCASALHDLYLRRRGAGLHSVRDKYSRDKFEAVANTPAPPVIPESFFFDITP